MATQLLEYFQTYHTDTLGRVFLTGIVNVASYNKVNLQILQWPHVPVTMTVTCVMGKISGSTLSQVIAQFPLGTTSVIHSFPVIGPEFQMYLTGGTPSTAVPIQAWIFLN